MKLIARKDKKHHELLQKFDIFFCRGKGYPNKFICSAYNSYISAHPYHSHHDITIGSSIELHKINQKLIVSVYYAETDSTDRVINQNTDFYKSMDNGINWIKVDDKNEPVRLSQNTVICSLRI